MLLLVDSQILAIQVTSDAPYKSDHGMVTKFEYFNYQFELTQPPRTP
jgi:hypothetical protein